MGLALFYASIMCIMLIGIFSSKALGQVLMVDKAYALLKEGQLEKSRQAIDIATEHSSTSNDPRAWYLKSFIYKEIASVDSIHASELRASSIQSAQKCMALDPAKQFAKDCQTIITFIYTDYLNEAIQFLNQQDFERVLSALQPIAQLDGQTGFNHRPEALFYYGYASLQLGKTSDAQKYFFKALQSGYQDPLIYETEAFYRMNTAQWDSARWYLTKGREQFPKDKNLQIAELNFLMDREDYLAAENVVKRYLEQYPDNVEGLLLAGTIYEKLLPFGKEEDQYFQHQISAYERIIEQDKNHLQANYNMGIAYYNQAVKLINGAAQDYTLDIVAFNELLEQCSALFLKALPYIEKVNTMDNNHVNALKALEGIYYNINDYQQYNLVKEKLEKL